MVTTFTVALLMVIYFVVYLSFTEQDTILDTHEFYYYSHMVESWGIPPDTTKILEDLENLKMIGGIYKNGKKIWSFPNDFSNDGYLEYSDSQYLGDLYGIKIPLYVTFGDLAQLPAATVDNGDYKYFLAINYESPSELMIRIVPASILTLVFMVILFFFIQRYLYPIKLMKRRIFALEQGDLDSTIFVQGDDELADLSRTINKLIFDIKHLLTQKQNLLADVSHELRSPLARMQLLIEMIPAHKNVTRLKQEVKYLEQIISNLLLSDKLSVPFKSLEISVVELQDFIDRIVARIPQSSSEILISGDIPEIKIKIDSTKMRIAFTNLLENALKYGHSDKPIEISCSVDSQYFLFCVKDFGPGIEKTDLDRLTEPFFRGAANKRKDGVGLGLSITKKIVLAHGGDLQIQSEPGKGSLFSIRLPVSIINKK
ncbi:MAG: ATP-binding protein [Fidelibacterota bacterium]